MLTPPIQALALAAESEFPDPGTQHAAESKKLVTEAI
jgi:hypothetical protein